MITTVNTSTRAGRWPGTLSLPLTILAWLAVAVVVGWLLGHVARTLAMVAVAAVVAFALAPLVEVFNRRAKRPLAIAAAYLVGLIVVIGLGAVLVVVATEQARVLLANLPSYGQQVEQLAPRIVDTLGPFGIGESSLQAFDQRLLSVLQEAGRALLASSVGLLTGTAGLALDVVLTVMLSVYLTANGPRIAQWLETQTPPRVRPYAQAWVRLSNQVVGGYIRSTLAMAALAGVLVGGGMAVLGVPYAALLGLIACLMAFVPVVGTLFSGLLSVAAALACGPTTALVVLAYFVIVHVVQDDVVAPRIVSRAVGTHPLVGLIALLVGTEVLGVWGALFAAPVAGLLQAVVVAAWRNAIARGLPSGADTVAAVPVYSTGLPQRDGPDTVPDRDSAA